jgi:hypothetical protein
MYRNSIFLLPLFKDNGLSELLLVYEDKTALRQFMSTMVLLGYHLFLTTFMGNKEVDVRLCNQILEEKVSIYPKGVFFLFFKGRFHLVQVCKLLNTLNTDDIFTSNLKL